MAPWVPPGRGRPQVRLCKAQLSRMRMSVRILMMAALVAAGAGHVLAQGRPPASQGTTPQRPAQNPPPRPTPAQPALPPVAPAPQAAPVDNPTSVCGLPIPQPARLPPAGSAPIVYLVVPCFQKQGGFSVIDPQTYLYYMQLHGSRPSE